MSILSKHALTGRICMAGKGNKPAPTQKVVYRRSDKGTFVTEKYAKAHPKFTEKEIVP